MSLILCGGNNGPAALQKIDVSTLFLVSQNFKTALNACNSMH